MQSLRILGAVSALVLAFGFGSNKAHAVGAPAGTVINNTAEVNYTVGTVTTTASSNLVSVTVAEILDVVVTAQTPTVAVTAGDTQQEVRYRVTNTGNGTETFRLVMNSVIAGDQFDPVAATPSIYFDTDASGDLSPGDTPYVVGSNDPVLSADGFVTVLLVNDIPAGVVDTNVGLTRLTADSRTGTGVPGTTFAGQGVGGVDAVVGTTGADSEADSSYVVSGVSLTAAKTPDRGRPVRRLAPGAGCAHQLLDRGQRHRLGHRDQRGVHRQHSREHHLRSWNAAPQCRGALGWRRRRCR